MASYLITGTGQGIGLELVKQLLDLPASGVSHVFALTRSKPSTELQTLLDSHSDRTTSVIASVTDETAVKAAAEQVSKKLGDKGLDVLVNNAGAGSFSPGGAQNVPAAYLKSTFDLNVVGVHLVTVAFLPLLEKGQGKKIVNMSVTPWIYQGNVLTLRTDPRLWDQSLGRLRFPSLRLTPTKSPRPR